MRDANACTELSKKCPDCRKQLRLCTGDPVNDPATYTRFVLPFAYQLTKPSDSVPSVCYSQIPPLENKIDIWRRRYLTDETEEVLFRRAKWFKLNNVGTTSIDFMFDRRTDSRQELRVCLKPPIVILFEYPQHPDDQLHNHDILCSGLLVQDVYFDENSEATFDDLLKLNELFRYWQRPFDGHDESGDWQDARDDNGNLIYKGIAADNQGKSAWREKTEGGAPTYYEKPAAGGYKTLLQKLPLILGRESKTIGDACGEDDIYFDRWANLLKYPIEINNSYFQIVTDLDISKAKEASKNKLDTSTQFLG